MHGYGFNDGPEPTSNDHAFWVGIAGVIALAFILIVNHAIRGLL